MKDLIKLDDIQKKFWDHVVISNHCWTWNGQQNKSGYGVLYYGLKQYYAHRFSALIHGWHIPHGKEVHHTCKTRNCVNPGHFQFVSHSENMRLINEPDFLNTDYYEDAQWQDYKLTYDLLPNNLQCIVALCEDMAAFDRVGRLDAIKKMLEINRFYDNKLIKIPETVKENFYFDENYDQIIIEPFKRKYFLILKHTMDDFGISLGEIEILLSKPLDVNLKKYLDRWKDVLFSPLPVLL